MALDWLSEVETRLLWKGSCSPFAMSVDPWQLLPDALAKYRERLNEEELTPALLCSMSMKGLREALAELEFTPQDSDAMLASLITLGTKKATILPRMFIFLEPVECERHQPTLEARTCHVRYQGGCHLRAIAILGWLP